MKNKKQIESISDAELVELFNRASSTQEKLQYFSSIQDYNCQMELLHIISDNEKYKFIGRIKSSHGIAIALNSLMDSKTFNFVAKQFKGNNIGLLKILTQIDFDITIPPNMLTFQLNNINALSLDFLINIQRHTINYLQMKFKINEDDDSRNIEYSFSEISAIIAKIEELTADIPKEMSEANKFYTIYSRITGMITYDHNCIRQSDNAESKLRNPKIPFGSTAYRKELKAIRKNPAGLYGGLIDGKAICAGYALILHEALKYIGMKSQYVYGYKPEAGHAWNQIQIDRKWYNADPTWDAKCYQIYGTYEYMLLSDKEFDLSHGNFSNGRPKTYHTCNNRFDYSKIQGLSPNQIKMQERTQ